MNKQYDFSQSGGFPISQNVMDYIQESYSEALGGMSKMIGHLTIVSGDPTKSGWIYLVIDGVGEILPFVGNIKANVFSVKETTEGLLFQNNERKQVKITRSVLPGIWNGSPAYSPLNTPPRELGGSIADLWDEIKAIRDEIQPIGTIKMWGQNATTAPTNWMFCRGQRIDTTTEEVDFPKLLAFFGNAFGGDNATWLNLPDLAGRVPVGAGTLTGDSTLSKDFPIGEKLGGGRHKLEIPEMPAHTHTVNNSILCQKDSTNNVGTANNGRWTYDTVGNMGRASTSSIGSGSAHNNLQPYQVINYIIKVR